MASVRLKSLSEYRSKILKALSRSAGSIGTISTESMMLRTTVKATDLLILCTRKGVGLSDNEESCDKRPTLLFQLLEHHLTVGVPSVSAIGKGVKERLCR
jgi:hypothetical protein